MGGGAISQTGLPQNSISTSPSPITMTPCYILKRTFTKVNLLNYPNKLGGCYLANWITTKLHLHFPLPHYNDTVLYSKTNFYKSQPPQLPQQFGGVLSRKPDYHKTPSPLPPPPSAHYNDTVLYSKTNFYKSQPPQLPQQFEGGCYLANRITTKLHLHFPLPHYNDTVLYTLTNFYKSQPPQLPQQFEGGALSQTGLPQNSISTSPSPIMTPCFILKRTFTKVNLLNYPNNLGGCYLANRITTKLHLHFPLPHYNDTMLYSETNFYKSSTIWGVLSRKPDYHKTPSPLPPPPL